MATQREPDPRPGRDPGPRRASENRRFPRTAMLALIAAAALASTLAASAALRDRESDPRDHRGSLVQPLRVAVEALTLTDSFERTRSYLGRVEPARVSALGFERAGRLDQIRADEGA